MHRFPRPGHVQGGSAGSRRWRTLLLSVSTVAVVAGSFVQIQSSAAAPNARSLGGREGSWYVPGEVLVRFRDDVSAAAMSEAHDAVGAEVRTTFAIVPNLQLVHLTSSADVVDAVARYTARAEVLYAEPNMRLWIDDVDLTPNDPLYPSMWNLNNTGQTGGTPDADIDAPEAWKRSTGSPTVAVGVIDTGIDYTHEDLAAHAMPNAAECSGAAGVDDDANGYVDDCHGIDPFNGDSDPMDDHDHGSHTSGTIGAVGNNGIGVTGINWDVQIVACKSHNLAGAGTEAAVIECLQYMEIMKAEGLNIVATNNSYGGCPEACAFSQAFEDAIRSNMEEGILFVASAGNDGTDNDEVFKFPTNYFVPNVISVAATDHDDALASFSEWGRRSVDLGAPGVDVLSTVIGGYAEFSGTSMASPHVTGLAALLEAQQPARDWRVIRNLILTGGDAIPSLNGLTVTGRRLNANGSMTCRRGAVTSALEPLGQSAVPVILAAINIQCAKPSRSSVSVTVSPGGATIALVDTGTGADEVAKDGIFTGTWAPFPCVPGTYTFAYSFGQSTQSVVTCAP